MYTISDIDSWIAQGEGFHIEFKENTNTGLAKELVAFANAKGGKIILGVDDSGVKKGVSSSNSKRSVIQDYADSCDPPVQIQIEEITDSGVVYIIIKVPEGSTKPYRCTAGFYHRQGPNSVKMRTDAIRNFFQSEGRVRFDAMVDRNTFWTNVYSSDHIYGFRKLIKVGTELGNPILLQNIGAIDKDHPTNAGILMFADRPTAILPQSMVQCVLYQGIDKVNILDRKDLTGTIVNNIEDAVIFLKKHLNVARKIEGLHGRDELEIPERALREVVVNALLHRDYFRDGSHVSIEVFSDRVEIASPGPLPPGLNETELGKRSVARNPIIADMLSRTPYIERLGTGYPRIQSDLKEAGLDEAQFNIGGFVTVTIKRRTLTGPVTGPVILTEDQWITVIMDLNNQETGPITGPVKDRIVKELNHLLKQSLNIPALAEKIGEPPSTVKKDISRLRKLGVVRYHGSNRAGGYIFTEEAKKRIGKV